MYIVHVHHWTASDRRYKFCTQLHMNLSSIFQNTKRFMIRLALRESSSMSDTGVDEAPSPNLLSEASMLCSTSTSKAEARACKLQVSGKIPKMKIPFQILFFPSDACSKSFIKGPVQFFFILRLQKNLKENPGGKYNFQFCFQSF